MKFFHEPQPGSRINPHRLFQGAFIPDGVMTFRRLSAAQKLCYGQLMRMAGANGRCWPSVRKLCVTLGVTERGVQKMLRALERELFITRDPRPGRSNVYLFLWHPTLSSPKTYRRDVHVTKTPQ